MIVVATIYVSRHFVFLLFSHQVSVRRFLPRGHMGASSPCQVRKQMAQSHWWSERCWRVWYIRHSHKRLIVQRGVLLVADPEHWVSVHYRQDFFLRDRGIQNFAPQHDWMSLSGDWSKWLIAPFSSINNGGISYSGAPRSITKSSSSVNPCKSNSSLWYHQTMLPIFDSTLQIPRNGGGMLILCKIQRCFCLYNSRTSVTLVSYLSFQGWQISWSTVCSGNFICRNQWM